MWDNEIYVMKIEMFQVFVIWINPILPLAEHVI